jgi:hypothetical protein
MDKQKDIEKKFAQYIDRIMAGESIQLDPSMDAEMRADLDFLKKVRSLGQTPTAQFEARLRAYLLAKLEAQQAQQPKEGWSFFRIFRQPAWQAAIAVMLVILVISIVWRQGVFRHEENLAPSSPAATTTPASTQKTIATTAAPTTTKPATTIPSGAAAPVVSIDAQSNKSTYKAGETVSISISMKNVSGQPLNLTDFPPIMSVMQSNTRKPVYTFHAGTTAMTLAPNQSATYTYTWDQTDFNGQQVTGSYYVELEDLEYNGQPYNLNLNNPVDFTILY